MAFHVIIRDRATQDLRQQANYILAIGNRDAAERFLESAEYAFNQLAIAPNIGKIVALPDIAMIRRWRIKNFTDYLIFYRIKEDQVEILRVLHGARDLENIMDFLAE
jgi:toxin ParE1/3/4